MRIASHILALACSIAPFNAALASPDVPPEGLNLRVLDMNGTPFGSFHLGYYQDGLEATGPRVVGALPSESLHSDLVSRIPADADIGVTTSPGPALPQLGDIAAVLSRYGDALSYPRQPE